jgi:hypothetical protein
MMVLTGTVPLETIGWDKLSEAKYLNEGEGEKV